MIQGLRPPKFGWFSYRRATVRRQYAVFLTLTRTILMIMINVLWTGLYE